MELLTTLSGQLIVGIFAAINLVAFIVMAHDKHKAIQGHNAERLPEGSLFFLATIFGAIGVYVGMFAFRHKTKKWYFQIGIPLLIVQNLITVYVIGMVFF